MKKRLLVIFSIFIVVVILIIICSTVFTVQRAEIYFHNEDGQLVAGDATIIPSEIIEGQKGKSIVFLSESELINSIQSNPKYSDWYVVGIVRSFPNKVMIHLAERVPVFYLSKGGVNYLVDVLGYVVESTEDSNSTYIDVSQFALKIDNATVGARLTFSDEKAKTQLDTVAEMTKIIWRFNYNYSEITKFVKSFTFKDDTTLVIKTVSGAVIEIVESGKDLETKLTKAVGVYNNTKIDMTAQNVTITVDASGRVTTINNNK